MIAVHSVMFVVWFAVILSEVTSWTVDLAEVEKLLNTDQVDENSNDDDLKFTNIISEDDNEVVYTSNYADNFAYQTFKMKEVGNITQNGSVYLEGLSKALAVYRNILDNCGNKKSESRSQTSIENDHKCEEAMKNKENVQKLSELALITTDKLRDDAFENSSQDDGVEEDGILQLAWTLDRLAYLTGYASDQKNFTKTGAENSTNLTTDSITKMPTEPTTKHVQELEILEQVENGRPLSNLPPKPLADVKSVRKRDTNSLMKYYVKYKVWNGSNPINNHETEDNNGFDVENSLKVLPIRKRSVTVKKAANLRLLDRLRNFQSKLKNRSKNSVRKLVKSIKVYRRKIFTSNNDKY